MSGEVGWTVTPSNKLSLSKGPLKTFLTDLIQFLLPFLRFFHANGSKSKYEFVSFKIIIF